MKDYIARPKYNDRIKPFVGADLIKVLVGQRRVGKSYLLRQVRDEIALAGACNFILIDKENEAFDHIRTAANLTEYIKTKAVTTTGATNYLMIDEVQEIAEFENSVRSFAAKPNFDVYLTGSNSEILSSELATRLSGRYIEIPVYSLDFNEFSVFHDLEKKTENLHLFLKYGGMPFLRNLALNDEQAFEYLKNVFTSILYRDVVGRYSVRNVNFLDRLIRFTADNIGSMLNAKKISDYLKSQQVNISVNTVLDYLSYLVNAQIIVPVKRMELKGKRILEVNEKYYFQDMGIRNALSGYRVSDMGKLMENCVFNHLISHGYTVYTGDWQQKEIDFVAEKNNERVYIQVAYLLTEPSTIEREFGNLELIRDNYKKMVVSMDVQSRNTRDGIEHWNLLQFLADFS
ncbi:MAG: ATP-binding protein [Saprospiraceae bacterium]|nr:ATP-binding protein [Saprospiraceae bacterium]